MKKIDEFKTTTNRTIYIRCKRALHREGCPICPPHGGCNRRRRHYDNNWKRHRQKQYREV